MFTRILTVVALLACAGSVQATCTCDGVDNCLGVYFDLDTWEQTCLEPNLFVPFHLYFVLQNSTIEELGGFEFSWRLSPLPDVAPIILNAVFPNPYGEFLDNYNIIFGSGLPIPAGEPVILLDLTMITLAILEADLQLGPATPASLPGHGAINDFDNPSYIIPINFPCPVGDDGWTSEGVAQFGDCTVAADRAAWGDIKTLFR